METKKSITWQMIKKYGRRAGKEVLALAEAAWLTLNDSDVSVRHKTALIGSLVYLISPIDALPDFLPGGYTDDLSIMLTAVISSGKIGKKHLKKCRIKHGLSAEIKDEK